jgi:hypothetical protein
MLGFSVEKLNCGRIRAIHRYGKKILNFIKKIKLIWGSSLAYLVKWF